MGENYDRWKAIHDQNVYEGVMKDTYDAAGQGAKIRLMEADRQYVGDEQIGSAGHAPRSAGHAPPQSVTVPAAAQEIRATDPNSGGQKGVKLARFSLIPWDAIWKVAEHFGIGARKYEDRNWERGYPWSWSYDALLRHLASDMDGEERDPETGSLHITAVAWHALILIAFRLRGSGTDDRRRRIAPPANVATPVKGFSGAPGSFLHRASCPYWAYLKCTCPLPTEVSR